MARTNADNPDLSVWVTGFEAITSSNFARINLKVSGFEIDRNNFAIVAFFDLRSHLGLVNFITTTSVFFLGIAGVSNCHRITIDFSIFSSIVA